MKRRMEQLAAFILHCEKHIERKKRGLYLTHVRCPNVYQQTQTLTVSNVKPNVQRYAFVYVNIVHRK